MRAILVLSLLVAGAVTGSPPDLTRGLGTTEHSRMRMKYEVTLFRLDVAEITARVSDETAARLTTLIAGPRPTDTSRRRIEEELLRADPVLVSLEFLRDAGLDRFLGGTRMNLEGAAEANVISEAESSEIWEALRIDFSPLEPRGVLKGDRVFYRLDGDRVRMVYLDPAGDVLLDFTHTGDHRSRGLKGAFFSRGSSFSRKLIRSLFPH